MSAVGQLGVSYMGPVFLLSLLVPNVVWALTATSKDHLPGAEKPDPAVGWSGPVKC